LEHGYNAIMWKFCVLDATDDGEGRTVKHTIVG